MKRRTAIVIAATAAVGTGLTIGLVAGLSSSGQQDGSQFYSSTQPWPLPTSFTAAVPCKLNGQPAMCATVNGIPVILTGTGYKPLTAAQIKQVEDSAPSGGTYPQEGSGGRQDPAYDPAVAEPHPVAPEHVSEPDPVEVEPHVVIVDGK